MYHYLRHVGRKFHEAISSEVYAQCRAACVTFAISHRSPNTDQEHYIQQSFDLVRLLSLVVGGWRCLCFAIAGGPFTDHCSSGADAGMPGAPPFDPRPHAPGETDRDRQRQTRTHRDRETHREKARGANHTKTQHCNGNADQGALPRQ